MPNRNSKAAEAELTTLRATLQRELLDQESIAARVHSEYQQAKMESETNDNLAKNGLVADLTHKTSKIKAEDLGGARRDRAKAPRIFARFHRAADRLEAGGGRSGEGARAAEERSGGAAAR